MDAGRCHMRKGQAIPCGGGRKNCKARAAVVFQRNSNKNGRHRNYQQKGNAPIVADHFN